MTSAPSQLRITARDGSEFYRRLAAFAYLSSLTHGVGVAAILQGEFKKGPNGEIDANVRYLPYTPENTAFPPEVLEMVDRYQPATDVILMTVDAQDRATCVQLTSRTLGATPKALCEEWATGELAMPWLPGQLVALDEPAEDLDLVTGYYAFIWRDGSTLLLRRVEVDQDEMEASGSILRIHVDFTEMFRAVPGMNLFEPEAPG